DAARLMGINVRAAIAFSFALSTALAGLAGMLIAPLFSIHSEMGTLFGIKAFAVAILGGISSASGVMLAGLLYGLIEASVTAFAGSTYTQIVVFAVVTIAFAFIVQHGTIEWKDLTGGQNGLMGLVPPDIRGHAFTEREMALFAVLLAGLSLYFFHRLAASAWGKAMVAVRDSETAARSIGLNPVTIKTAAFAVSAAFAGLAGAVFAPLMMFVAPDSFPFSASILCLLAVIVGGSGWVFGPAVGAVVTVLLPELLAWLAEYRLLLFGALLLVVLWLAPAGVIGTLARHMPR